MHAIKKHLPNALTYSRILVIPALVITFYMSGETGYLLSAGLFAYASVTDFFDGYLARAWDVQSSIGRFLDPIADKLLVATALLLLVSDGRADVLPAIAILCREILVSGMREFLAELREKLPVTLLAKYKTGIQMGAIFFLLLGPGGPHWLHADISGNWLLWLAAALTITTGYGYFRAALRHMVNG